MLFRKQASKDSIQCDSTDRHPRINIVSEPSTSISTTNGSRPSSYKHTWSYRPQKKNYWWVMYDASLEVCIVLCVSSGLKYQGEMVCFKGGASILPRLEKGYRKITSA